MNKILAMREKRGEVWDKAKAFLNEHQDENGMLSPEDAAQYERMEQEVVDLGHAIEREERAAQMERELNAPTTAPLASRPEARPDSRTGRLERVQGRFLDRHAQPRRSSLRPECFADRHGQRGRLPRAR